MIRQHYLRLKQPMNYPIPRLTSVKLATIGSIGYHWLTIVKHHWHQWGTQCIFDTQQQSWHRLPNPIFHI
jgi:hypothetical protein